MSGTAKTIIRDQKENKENIQENKDEKFLELLDKIRAGEKLTIDEANFLADMSLKAKQEAVNTDTGSGLNANITDPDKPYKPDGSAKKVQGQEYEPGKAPEGLPNGQEPLKTSEYAEGSWLQKQFANPEFAKDAGLIKLVRNVYNELGGQEDPDFADKILGAMAAGKNEDKSFSDVIRPFASELIDKLGRDKVKDVVRGLRDNYDGETFGRIKKTAQYLTHKEQYADSRLASAEQKVADALTQNKEHDDEAAMKAAKRFANGAGDMLSRVTAGGQDYDKALKSLYNNAGTAFEKGGKHLDAVLKTLDKAQQADHDKQFWIDYFKENPDTKLKVMANRNTTDKAMLLVTAFNEAHPQGQAFPLIKQGDVRNFLDGRLEGNGPMPDIEFTNLDSKSTDATGEVSRNQKWVERYKQMFTTGDTRYAFQDKSLNKLVDRDENGFVTETNRDVKHHYPNLRKSPDSMYRTLADMFKKYDTDTLKAFAGDGPISDGSPMSMTYKKLMDKWGDDARQLFRDTVNYSDYIGNDVTGDDKGIITPDYLRSLSKKFEDIRKLNKGKLLTDIIKNGDLGEAFGKIHSGMKPEERLPLLQAFDSLNRYKLGARRSMDLDALREDLDTNITAIQNAVGSGNFGDLADKVPQDKAADILSTLRDVRKIISTGKEKEAMAKELTGGEKVTELSEMQTLAEAYPDQYEDLISDLADATAEYKAAKDAHADFDVVNMWRDKVHDLINQKSRFETFKAPVLAEAESSGLPYHEIAEKYNKESDEDYMNNLLAEYDVMQNLKDLAGGKKLGNTNVKAEVLAEMLDKVAGVDSRLSDWRDTLSNWSKPVSLKMLTGSQQTAKDLLNWTPEMFSAYNTNKGLFDTEKSDIGRNRVTYGQRKSRNGMANADADAADEFIKNYEMAKYVGDEDKVKEMEDQALAENAAAKDPYTLHTKTEKRLEEAGDTLKNLLEALGN